MLVAPFIGWFWQALDQFTRDPNAPLRTDYFYSQLPIMWDYVLRFVWPFSQQLEIEAQLYQSFAGPVAAALAGHIALAVFAWRWRHKMALFTLGVVLFYAGHAIESSIIPIKDLAFEHRTYISNLGLVLAVLALLKYGLNRQNRWLKAASLKGLAAATCLLFIVLTFNRVTLWQEPMNFYAQEVQLSPTHARANASYGNEFLDACSGQCD